MIESISNDALIQQMQELTKSSETMGNGSAVQNGDGEFGNMLGKLINDVDSAQKDADLSIQNLATGDSNSLQDVVMKMEQAEVSFQLMKEIRNKLMEAYKEVMQMQT